MENAVLVKVDPSTVVRRQESVTLFRQNPAYTRNPEGRVTLHVATLAASVVLQSPAGGLKCIVDCLTDILVWDLNLKAFIDLCFAQSSQARAETRCALDHDFFSRHFYMNAKVIRASLPVVTMRHFERYATAHYAIEESIQLVGFSMDPLLDCG
jgi:hypothetical protein